MSIHLSINIGGRLMSRRLMPPISSSDFAQPSSTYRPHVSTLVWPEPFQPVTPMHRNYYDELTETHTPIHPCMHVLRPICTLCMCVTLHMHKCNTSYACMFMHMLISLHDPPTPPSFPTMPTVCTCNPSTFPHSRPPFCLSYVSFEKESLACIIFISRELVGHVSICCRLSVPPPWAPLCVDRFSSFTCHQ